MTIKLRYVYICPACAERCVCTSEHACRACGEWVTPRMISATAYAERSKNDLRTEQYIRTDGGMAWTK